MPITRTPMVDDDGSGQSGTVINNPWKVELYDQIDGALGPAAAIPAPGAAGNLMTSTGAAWASQPSIAGVQINQPFNQAHFRAAAGGGSWVVTGGVENNYFRIGNLLHWALYVVWFGTTSTLTGTVTSLGVTLPAGMIASLTTSCRLGSFFNGNGAFLDVMAQTAQSSGEVTLKPTTGAFIAGQVGMYTMLTLPVV